MIIQLKRPSIFLIMIQGNEIHFQLTYSASKNPWYLHNMRLNTHFPELLYTCYSKYCWRGISYAVVCVSLTYHSFHLFRAHHYQMFTSEKLQKALFVVYIYIKA